MKNTIIKMLHFMMFWAWVDFERLFRKSHGINGYIQSLKFYWNVHKQFNLPNGEYYNPETAITIMDMLTNNY